MPAHGHSDLELLSIRARLYLDKNDRVADAGGVTIVVAGDGYAHWIGAQVPDTLISELNAIVATAPNPSDPTEPPDALEACRGFLERATGSRLARHGGPCYLFPSSREALSSDAHIERSDTPLREDLRGANPGNWGPVEWDELIEGRLGPWAMATLEGQVLSICHTPVRMTELAAECGVWTRPDARGRGYAAASAAEWAAILRPSDRYLFYSTEADNISSQQVARRLKLRPLGWRWRISSDRDEARRRVHPLSREVAGG